MKRTDKESFVAEFTERVRQSPVFYLTDFSGLNVKAMTKLRRELRQAGAEYLVVKNRLVVRVLEELDLAHDEILEQLKGPTGVVVIDEGPVMPAKALSDFAKANGDRPVFKVGLLDEKVVAADQFDRLAKLPPREQLLAELAGALEAPMAALASVLEAKIQETSGLLDALREKKAAE
jgi:large subunit ribosomal protein L10